MLSRLLPISLLVLTTFGVRAQIPQYSYTSATTTSNTFPFATTTSNKVQYLYQPANFSGSPTAGLITKVYFKSSTTGSNISYSNLMIRIGNTALNTFSSGAFVSNLTTVLSAPTYAIASVTNGGWVQFTLQSPIPFSTTQNMIVEASQTAYTTGFNVAQASLSNRRLYGNVGSATGTAGSGLANFGFDLAPLVPNNASASQITEPYNFCAGTYPVKLKIRNNGNNTINNVQINWLLDGVAQTPINYTTPPLGPATGTGSEAIVTLGNVTFATGHTVKAWTSLPNGAADTVNFDDTVSVALHPALSGTYTIGGASPDYQNIADAAAALNLYGICGPVVFNIRNGTYTGSQAQINKIAGASAVNRVTFKSETNSAANVTLSYAATGTANNFVFRLNNASYVTIRDLTINPTGAAYARGIELTDSASYDSLLRCTVQLPNISSTSSNFAAIYATGLNGTSNVVKGNTLQNGNMGIYWYGSGTTDLAPDHILDSNTVQNASYYGIYTYYTKNLKVRNNTITNTAGTYSSFYGLSCSYGDSALVVSGNTVNTNGSGTVYGMRIYYCDGDPANPAKSPLVNGNRVTVNTSGTTYGLYHYYASNSYIVNNIVDVTTTGSAYALYNLNTANSKVYNNTIISNSTGATNYTAYLSGSSATYGGCKLRNNIFRNASATGYAMYCNTPTFLSSDYNNITSASPDLCYDGVNGTAVATLHDWRVAMGQERSSISHDPGFISATNLQPDPANPSTWSVNGRGEQAAWNTTDRNGNSRYSTLAAGVPDIGPYEFLPAVLPPLAVAAPAVPAAGTTQVFTFGSDTVSVIEWAASSTVPASVDVRQYSGVMPPTFPAGEFMYFYTDMSATGGPFNYMAHVYYKDSWLGTSSLETALRMARKDGSAAWVFMPTGSSTVNITWNKISAPALTTLSTLYSGRTEQCSGTPLMATFATPAFASPKCVGDSVTIDAVDPNGTIGITYQWEQATVATGPWSVVTGGSGGTTLSYNTPSLNDTMYYRLKVTCSGNSSYSAAFIVPVILPQITSTAPATRCGVGQLTLGVTATPGTMVIWYPAPTGYTALDTGNTYTTPVLSSTTTYYVEASTGLNAYLGKPSSTGADGSNTGTGVGLVFDAYTQFNLESVGVYPIGSGAGTITIALEDAAGTVLQSATVNLTGTAAPGVYTTIPLNFTVPPGTGHRLLWAAKTGGVTGLIRDYTANSGITFPYTLPGVASITGGTTATYYYYFYNWRVKDGCVSARVPVTATVVPAPAVSFTPSAPTICLGETANIVASSSNSGYTYTWEPGSITGSSVNLSPTVTTDYYITALDNSGGANNGCILYDTVTVIVNPLPAASVTVNGSTNLCTGDTVELKANTGAQYVYQWQNNGVNINGATDSILVVTEGGNYAVVVTNSNNCVATSAAELVTVYPLPMPTITDNGGVLSTGTYAAYQWLRNGQILAGATGQTYTPVVDGTYTVVVTDFSGCTNESAPYGMVLGIADFEALAKMIKVFPNPAKNFIQLEAPVKVNIVLSTFDGKEVLREKNAKKVDVGHLAAGIYLLRIYDVNDTPVKTEKMVKE